MPRIAGVLPHGTQHCFHVLGEHRIGAWRGSQQRSDLSQWAAPAGRAGGSSVILRVDDHIGRPLVAEHHDFLMACNRFPCPPWNPDFFRPDGGHSYKVPRYLYGSVRNCTELLQSWSAARHFERARRWWAIDDAGQLHRVEKRHQ